MPVAPAVALCEDESVNGAPFYVMEFVEGPILRTKAEAEESFGEADRRAIGERVVDTLVAIHAVDPDAVGLGDLGRKEDYVARQLRRWHGQWEKSKTRELEVIDDVHRRLSERIPEQGPATIVHGDYRLDNLILSADGEIAAVVDWELCTLGDPLADVGMLLVYWSQPGDELMPLFDPPTTAAGFPLREDVRRRYCRALRARPGGDRLLRRPRLLEARDHPRGRLRPLRGGAIRQGRGGLPAVRQGGRAAGRGRRPGRATPGLTAGRRLHSSQERGKLSVRRMIAVLTAAAVSVLAIAGTAWATTHPTSTSFGFAQNPDTALGQINFNTGPRACRQGRHVKLFLKRHGSDRRVGSDSSDSAGQWEIERDLRDGKKYYAKIPGKDIGGGDKCASHRTTPLQFPNGTP